MVEYAEQTLSEDLLNIVRQVLKSKATPAMMAEEIEAELRAHEVSVESVTVSDDTAYANITYHDALPDTVLRDDV